MNYIVLGVVFKNIFSFCSIYRDDYNFFINILVNHLISISKWELVFESYFFDFELPYSKVPFVKNHFNINLV
jgi:hypothetical protein